MRSTTAPSLPLVESFVVCGLSTDNITTISGDAGFLGTDHRYRPSLLDCLPTQAEASSPLPPQLPTCCLPDGVQILAKDTDTAIPPASSYTVALTEGDGTKLYACCLAFFDHVPNEISMLHYELSDARALKCICVLSHCPYLSTLHQVLRQIYNFCFLTGPCNILVPAILQLLSVPTPADGTSKVTFSLGTTQHWTLQPLTPQGAPPTELLLQPLMEALDLQNLLLLFAAVLLERRVLLRSARHWLLGTAAEATVQLLYPLAFQHVYIPVMPYNLVDYIDAPTPFLMGLHASVPLDSWSLDAILVFDLDSNTVSGGGDLLPQALQHPAFAVLRTRLQFMRQPSLVRPQENPSLLSDPWYVASRQLVAGGWGQHAEQLARAAFLEFFKQLLDGFHGCLKMQHRRTSDKWHEVFDGDAFLGRHGREHGAGAKELISHLLQTTSFYSFVESHASSPDPYSWYPLLTTSLLHHFPPPGATPPFNPPPAPAPSTSTALALATTPLALPAPPPPNTKAVPPPKAPQLTPPKGCLHASFPLLIHTGGEGGRRMRSSSSSSKKLHTGGSSPTQAGRMHRRALSDELEMASDDKMKQDSLTDLVPRIRSVQASPDRRGEGLQARYGPEAELVRRQTAVLRHLLQCGRAEQPVTDQELLSMADIMKIQAGGTGRFLVARLKEEVGAREQARPLQLPPPLFHLLLGALGAVLPAAAHSEDWLTVLNTLQVASDISCTPTPSTTTPDLALHHLRYTPPLFEPWLWRAIFASAVSSEAMRTPPPSPRGVVAAQMAAFAPLLAGLGVSSQQAWRLLTDLASDHITITQLDQNWTAELRSRLSHLCTLAALSPPAAATSSPLRRPQPTNAPPLIVSTPRATPTTAYFLPFPPSAPATPCAPTPHNQLSHKSPFHAPPHPTSNGHPPPHPHSPPSPAFSVNSPLTPQLSLPFSSPPPPQKYPLSLAEMWHDDPPAHSLRRSASSPPGEPPLLLLDAPPAHPRVRMFSNMLRGPTPRQEQHVVALDAKGGVVMAAAEDGSTTLLRAQGGTSLMVPPPTPGVPCAPSCCRLSPTPQTAAFAPRRSSEVYVIDTPTGQISSSLPLPTGGPPSCLSFHPDSTLLACGQMWGTVGVLDLRAGGGRGWWREEGHMGAACNVAWGGVKHGGEEALVSAGADGLVCVWDMRKNAQPLFTLKGHTGWITSLAPSPAPTPSGQHLLVSTSTDGSAYVWNLAEGTCEGVLVGHGSEVTSAALLDTGGSKGPVVLTGAADGGVGVWSTTGRPLLMQCPTQSTVKATAFAGMGLAGTASNAVVALDVTSDPSLPTVVGWQPGSCLVAAMVYDPSVSCLVSGCRDGSIWSLGCDGSH